VLLDEAVDGALQVNEGIEDAMFEFSTRELGEQPLDGVEPRAGGRREVERPARMTRQSNPGLRMLVAGVRRENDPPDHLLVRFTVEDHMHGLRIGVLPVADLSLDSGEEDIVGVDAVER